MISIAIFFDNAIIALDLTGSYKLTIIKIPGKPALSPDQQRWIGLIIPDVNEIITTCEKWRRFNYNVLTFIVKTSIYIGVGISDQC